MENSFFSHSEQEVWIQRISNHLLANGSNLRQEIEKKSIYFRVSLTGVCNLSCEFCHNEGAPRKGFLDVDTIDSILRPTAQLGFTRVQFTGGEPLLHPEATSFVERARKYFSDVGITTNGILLSQKIGDLMRAGLTRLHVSIQEEAIDIEANSKLFGSLDWIKAPLQEAIKEHVLVRLNITASRTVFPILSTLLEEVSDLECDVMVLSQLPDLYPKLSASTFQAFDLDKIIRDENERRKRLGIGGKVSLRRYKIPTGIRCQTCPSKNKCRESSRSLRLGSDYVLRPCLASRIWEIPLDINGSIYDQIEAAAYLAIDY